MMQLSGLKKYLLITGGTLSLAVGVIGIFLPLVPTTPLLLLAAYCYIRSSRNLYEWLINHPVCGSYIYNYMTYRAVTRRSKIYALIFLWVTLVISMIVVSNIYITIILFTIGLGVTIHLRALKTMSRDEVPACVERIKKADLT